MRSRWLAILFLIVLCIAIAASWLIWLQRPTPTGALRLLPMSFAQLPGWTDSNPRAALTALRRGCVVLAAQPPTTAMGYAGAVADWRPVCAAAATVAPDGARAFFEQQFVPFAVNPEAGGLFTGYYEPLLRGSRTRHGAYQTPVYGPPSDLVTVDLGRFRPELAGQHVVGRVDGNRLVPYPTRAQIDAAPPPAQILFYGDDPIAVFFLHIQGSGRVQLDDGTTVRVAYAGQNGHPYTAIGRTLIRRGALTRKTASMQTIRAWLLRNPAEARAVLESDASFVFFQEAPVGDATLGSAGAQGAPLTPGASAAVDLTVHPLGVPLFIATATPDGKPLQKLFIAQDTGGAIRGAVRADIFFGFGAEAERLAGEMKAPGALFVLLPKAVAKQRAS